MFRRLKEKYTDWIISHEWKKWREKNYNTSVDSIFETIIAEKTNFINKGIIVWVAERDKDTHEFNTFKFQYSSRYYLLKDNELTRIKRSDIFN